MQSFCLIDQVEAVDWVGIQFILRIEMFSGGHVLLDFSAIPKLYGPENFWHWRMLLRAYLESADLWKDDHPKEVSLIFQLKAVA